MSEVQQYLDDLVGKVCIDLAGIYSPVGEPVTYGLIFPTKRNGSLRISEQEAKLLFVQHLTVDRQYFFSTETPTVETYQQKGTTAMSARVDLTLIDKDKNRVAHIELKAHNCTTEAIRKDLEKLLREKTTGCWFHTLERSDDRTIQALMAKFRLAFSLLANCLVTSDCSYLVAFFALDTGRLTSQWLHLTGDGSQNNAALDTAFTQSVNSGWRRANFGTQRTTESDRVTGKLLKSSPRGKGAREAFLFRAPKVAPNTFLHLSARGGSYRIRKYDLDHPTARPKPYTLPAYPSLDALRHSGLLSVCVPVTREDLAHNVDEEPQYWCERIRKMNSEHTEVED